MSNDIKIHDWIIVLLVVGFSAVTFDDLNQRERLQMQPKTCTYSVSDGRTTIIHKGTIE